MESALLDPAGGQRWVVYYEAWRLMSHPSLLRRMDAHWRLARHYGIANMLIFHKLTDLDTVGDQGSAMRALASSLLANAETRIIYRQESDQLGATADALGLTGTERQLLPTLGTGQGLWRIKDRSFVCQHQLHPAELELFDTIRWFADNGRPTPPRSACWFCPNSRNARRSALKDQHADLWERACELDEHIRDGGAFNARAAIYSRCDDTNRRLCNQALFTKTYIDEDNTLRPATTRAYEVLVSTPNSTATHSPGPRNHTRPKPRPASLRASV